MLPLTVGFLIAGPASGWLSDRFGARLFATGGMVLAALLRGRRYVHEEHGQAADLAAETGPTELVRP